MLLTFIPRSNFPHVIQKNNRMLCFPFQTFLPLLKKAASQHKSPTMSCSKAAVINISSMLGSLTEVKQSVPQAGTQCAFRMSKVSYG